MRRGSLLFPPSHHPSRCLATRATPNRRDDWGRVSATVCLRFDSRRIRVKLTRTLSHANAPGDLERRPENSRYFFFL